MEKEILINNLIESGWHVEDDFIDENLCDELASEFKSWKAAEIGKGTRQERQVSLRSDEISWLDLQNTTKAQEIFFKKIETLKQELNQSLFLGLKSYECHFSKYQNGGHYSKHLDQHQESKARILSTIVYLNTPQNGGELVIYNKEKTHEIDIKIAPQKGMLVCFLSDQIYHEVLPCQDLRLSLTGWFRASDLNNLL